MANIKEIAKKANVSVSTVSRVLNGHDYVSDEKREAVLAAIEQLNYTRNMNAVHLIKGKTNVIGVMLPFINHPYFSRLLEGISASALQKNYQLMLCQTDYKEEIEIKVLDMLKMKQIDAVIICSKHLPLDRIEPYTRYGPIVACEDVGDSSVSSVFLDHYTSFYNGMRYLIDRGHRSIGFCLGRSSGVNSQMRRKAYEDALALIHEPVREEWIFYQTYRIEDGVKLMRDMLQMEKRPSAMLVTNDQVAAGMIIEAKKNGLTVPDDLAVIGFDNQPIAEVFNLTTIDNQLFEMGSSAFQIAHDQIMKTRDEPEHRELEYRLIERFSV